MISVARKFGVQIDGTEASYSLHGDVIKYRRSTLLIDEPPLNLPGIRSRYFSVENTRRGVVFKPTPSFGAEMPKLSHRCRLVEYDVWTQQLLRFWQEEGGLDNLLFLSLVCANDGGIYALAAGLEHMLGELLKYTDCAFNLPGKRLPGSDTPRRRIKEADAALRGKLRVLRAAPEIKERLQKACRSVVGAQMLDRAVHYAPDCHLWNIVEWLANRLIQVVDFILDLPPHLPVFHSQAAGELAGYVTKFYEASMCTLPALDTHDNVIYALTNQLADKYDQWIRALITRFDPRYYDAMTAASAATTRTHVVCYDVTRSSKVLREGVKGNPDLVPRLDDWRKRLMAFPWNWSLLFDGWVVRQQGDKEIVLFEDPIQAFYSLVLAAAHLKVVHQREHDPNFPYLMKAGIGSGPVLLLAEQYESTIMNDTYHAIHELVDQKQITPKDEPVVLALQGFIEKHRQFEVFAAQEHQLKNGIAIQIDMERALHAFVGQLQ